MTKHFQGKDCIEKYYLIVYNLAMKPKIGIDKNVPSEIYSNKITRAVGLLTGAALTISNDVTTLPLLKINNEGCCHLNLN